MQPQALDWGLKAVLLIAGSASKPVAQVFDKLEQAAVAAKQVGLDTAALQVSGLKVLAAR